MKSIILSLFVILTFTSFSQNESPKYVFGNVEVQEKISGLNKKKVEKLANKVGDYLSVIEADNYSLWFESLSDSTKSRWASHRFQNKFNRLKGYNIKTDKIKIISASLLSTPHDNEAGAEYELIIELNADMDVSNRVNFDKLKTTNDKGNKRQFAMNIVIIEKSFFVNIHSYVNRGESDYNEERQLRYTFDNVEVWTLISGTGQGKARRLARLINSYLTAIETDDYDTWYATFSDSTISRVAPHKFPNKFKRLKEYNITTSTIKIISVNRFSEPFENEVGTEFEIVLELDEEMNVANRVSFDGLKRGETNANKRKIAINVIAGEKGFEMCVHKYTQGDKKKLDSDEK